jgi:hypothetical protein
VSEKPDYSAWDLVEEFTREQAAFLILDLQPRARPRDVIPSPVQALTWELGKAKPDRDTTQEKWLRPAWSNEPPRRQVIPGVQFYTRPTLRAWCEARGRRPPFLYPEERKKRAEPHGNAERFAKNREEVLGAALAVLAAFRESEHLEKGVTAAGLVRLVEDKAALFWPETGEPPLKHEPAERLIRDWLKKARP